MYTFRYEYRRVVYQTNCAFLYKKQYQHQYNMSSYNWIGCYWVTGWRYWNTAEEMIAFSNVLYVNHVYATRSYNKSLSYLVVIT